MAAAKVKARAKDKRGALFQLKRKKMLEKQIDQIYGKKTNLEMQILALESTINNKEIFDAMKEGKTALNNAINENDIDKMEDVMGDINESMVLADEFGEVMSQQIGPAMDEVPFARLSLYAHKHSQFTYFQIESIPHLLPPFPFPLASHTPSFSFTCVQ